MEAKVTHINQIWCHPPVSLTMEDKDTTLETMEAKDTTLETMEDKDTTLETMEAKDTTLEIMEAKDITLETMEDKATTLETMEAKDITLETMVDRDTIQGDTTLVAEMATRSISPAMALVDEANSELQLCLQTTKTLLTRAKPSPPSKLWEH